MEVGESEGVDPRLNRVPALLRVTPPPRPQEKRRFEGALTWMPERRAGLA